MHLERDYGLFSDDVVFEYDAGTGISSFDFDTSVYYKGTATIGSDEVICVPTNFQGHIEVRVDIETQSIHGIIVGGEEK